MYDKYLVTSDLESPFGNIKKGEIVRGKRSFFGSTEFGLFIDDVIELMDGRKFLDISFKIIKG